jgi:predicted aspartyl protease
LREFYYLKFSFVRLLFELSSRVTRQATSFGFLYSRNEKEAAVKRKVLYRRQATVLVFSCISLLLFPSGLWAADLEITLDSELDQIGSQIETVQVYTHGGSDWTTFGIYDTGASVVSVSYLDQFYFDILGYPAIPVLTSEGASAQGLDGYITGDVSQPGTVMADGLHALTIDLDNFDIGFDLSSMTAVSNVQVFLGTETGSAELPTITGTPIHSAGMAAKIDMQGYQIDFGEGLVINLPDMRFVAPGTPDAVLAGTTITPAPVRIPLQLVGEDNYANPGNNVTSSPNPIVNNVTLRQGLQSDSTYTANVAEKTFLFDTGAQISIISEEIALDLGIDLSAPLTTIQVQGAAGNPIDVSCYLIDALELPRDDDGNGVTDGTLKLSQVPAFVLDLSDFGIDGILGMNLWNTVNEMLYDPSDPTNPYVSLTFTTENSGDLTADELAAIESLVDAGFTIFSGALHNTTSIQIPGISPSQVPEPQTWALLTMALAGLFPRLFRRLRTKAGERPASAG